MASATSAPDAAPNGLIKAVHSGCDFGDRILHYLATGDNQGDPKLDTSFSRYVGVPLPQARSIADQSIQQCDASFSQQEVVQASAAASVKAEASRSAAEAQASAQAAQDKATRMASEQMACAPLGGKVRDGGHFADLCVSTSQGSTTDGSRTSCASATIPFQPDGTLSGADIASFKDGYPGCFS